MKVDTWQRQDSITSYIQTLEQIKTFSDLLAHYGKDIKAIKQSFTD